MSSLPSVARHQQATNTSVSVDVQHSVQQSSPDEQCAQEPDSQEQSTCTAMDTTPTDAEQQFALEKTDTFTTCTETGSPQRENFSGHHWNSQAQQTRASSPVRHPNHHSSFNSNDTNITSDCIPCTSPVQRSNRSHKKLNTETSQIKTLGQRKSPVPNRVDPTHEDVPIPLQTVVTPTKKTLSPMKRSPSSKGSSMQGSPLPASPSWCRRPSAEQPMSFQQFQSLSENKKYIAYTNAFNTFSNDLSSASSSPAKTKHASPISPNRVAKSKQQKKHEDQNRMLQKDVEILKMRLIDKDKEIERLKDFLHRHVENPFDNPFAGITR